MRGHTFGIIQTSAADNHRLDRGVEFRCCRSAHPRPPAKRRRLWVCVSPQRRNGGLQPLSRTADISYPSRVWTETVQQERCSQRKTCLYGTASRLPLLGPQIALHSRLASARAAPRYSTRRAGTLSPLGHSTTVVVLAQKSILNLSIDSV